MEKVDSDRRLYTRMRLWEHPDQYVIEPADGPFDSFLAISRVDGSLNMIGELPQCGSTPAPKMRTIYGLVGMLRLLAGAYMVVITERECVGSYLGYPMFKVSNLQIFPCNHALKISTAEQKKMETEFAVLLNAAERTSGLYFSYDVNLTLKQKFNVIGFKLEDVTARFLELLAMKKVKLKMRRKLLSSVHLDSGTLRCQSMRVL
ncbi:hypothetical protein AMTR_s00001p00019800 [Amborella trichopoda]|uniref:SAC domain-containing protein n=1 Tax=Amborella trichopoda TaxID=13333 RepID=W1NLJ1_AMBTC|nr:hypothetical protein AMTR_s00001p00019800 [Amborella trichopoda]